MHLQPSRILAWLLAATFAYWPTVATAQNEKVDRNSKVMIVVNGIEEQTGVSSLDKKNQTLRTQNGWEGNVLAVRPVKRFSKPLDKNGFRLWKTKDGKFEVTAKLLNSETPQVELEKTDGNRITVPVDNLSDYDRRYLSRGKIPDPAASAETRPLSDSIIEPKLDSARQIALYPGIPWTNKIDAATKPHISASFPSDDILFETPEYLKKVKFSSSGRWVLSQFATKSYGEAHLKIVDRQTPHARSQAAIPTYTNAHLSISDDQVVASSSSLSYRRGLDLEKSKGQIDFWKLENLSLTHVKRWIHQVGEIEFLDNERLMQFDRGVVTLWNWKNDQPVFQVTSNIKPAVNQARTKIAVSYGNKVFVIRLSDGHVLGHCSAQSNLRNLAFRNDEQWLAGTTDQGNVFVWSMIDGKTVADFAITGSVVNQLSPGLYFVAPNHLLLDGQILIDLRLKIAAWKYPLSRGVDSRGLSGDGVFWYSIYDTRNDITRLQTCDLPQDEILGRLSRYEPSSFEGILLGEKIAFDFRLPFKEKNEELRDRLTFEFEKNGFVVEPGAKTVCKCFTRTGKTVSAKYVPLFALHKKNAASITLSSTETYSIIQFVKDGKLIWQSEARSGGALPPFVSGTRQQIAKEFGGSKASPYFFLRFKPPRTIQSIGDGRDVLGESLITTEFLNN